MTLEQVMTLSDRELDAAVCERIDWKGEPWRYSPIDGMPFDHPFPAPAPEFHREWSAAMQIRDWALGLPNGGRWKWVEHLGECIGTRNRKYHHAYYLVLHAEPIDYARAALLVSVER